MGTRLITKGQRDANEAEIVDALRKAGCKVFLLDRPMDLLVGWRGDWHLLEVKAPGPNQKRLMPQQKECLELVGIGYRVAVVMSAEEALDAVGVKWRG